LDFAQLDRKIEYHILPRLDEIERRFYAASAVTQADLRVELALHEADDSGE
jgi:hypothetical protein